jgi:hypothetical protein
MVRHPFAVLLGLLLLLAGLGGALCFGVSGAHDHEHPGVEEEGPDPVVSRVRSHRKGELRALIRRPSHPIRYRGDDTSTDQAQVELRARLAAIRAQRWKLGDEQTARRLAKAERAWWRRHNAASPREDLDQLARAISSAADAARRFELLRRFQNGAAALGSPERERRLAQLDALIARR